MALPMKQSSSVKSKGKFLYWATSYHWDCSKRFTLYSLADLFNRPPSQFLWKVSSHATIKARMLFVHKYPLLYIARYSFVELSGFTRQHMIRTPLLLIESPKHYAWATALLGCQRKPKLPTQPVLVNCQCCSKSPRQDISGVALTFPRPL